MKTQKLLAALLIFLGIGVIGYWTMLILSGHLTEGLRTIESNSYIVLHQMAELVMALLALTGGILLWQNKPQGVLTAGIALGALLYSGINSLGWGLVNDPILAGLFVFVTAFSSWGIYWLVRNYRL